MMPQYWWFTYCLLPGLLASAILKMDGIGGLAGWRWIFILEGIATILIALISSRLLPADLSSARFFTEEERAFSRQLRTFTRSRHTNFSVSLQDSLLRLSCLLSLSIRTYSKQ